MTQADGHIRPDSNKKQSTPTRRAILSGGTIAVLAAGSISGAAASCIASDDALLAAANRYLVAEAASRDADLRAGAVSDEAAEAIYAEMMASFRDLLAMSPATVAGCIAMLRCLDSFGNHLDAHLFDDWHAPISGPASSLLRRVADALEQAEGAR